MYIKLSIALVLITMMSLSCSITKPKQTAVIPKSWITFQGNQYIYDSAYTTEEQKEFALTPTGEFTGDGDGAQKGLEIFQHPKSKSIFIKDESNGTRPWLRYSLKKN